jgi:FdhD protein
MAWSMRVMFDVSSPEDRRTVAPPPPPRSRFALSPGEFPLRSAGAERPAAAAERAPGADRQDGGRERRAPPLFPAARLVYRARAMRRSPTTAPIIAPDPAAAGLSREVEGVDHEGRPVAQRVVEERPLTIFLNGREIVTVMTIGDYPAYLSVGYLLNQGMLGPGEPVRAVEHDAEVAAVVVRTDGATDFEAKLAKKTRTSGCAVGTAFGDMMEGLEGLRLPPLPVRTSDLYALAAAINTMPSLYLAAGAIHGTVLCEGSRPLVYMEDVGRHNAVDKIAGWMALHGQGPAGRMLYTTGRLTSEMVIKTALMGLPALASRSGFTAWGVEIARRVGLTLIGRMRGRRFVCLSGAERLVWDADPAAAPEEDARHRRKGVEDDAA